MRTRFCAMMRSPACSISALIAPVRLRRVASGLMIEKVRSTAIDIVLDRKDAKRGREQLIARGTAQRQDAVPATIVHAPARRSREPRRNNRRRETRAG